MTDFSGLLRNELGKLAAHWSNRLLLAALILGIVCFHGAQRLSFQGESEQDALAESAQVLEMEIALLQEERPEGYLQELELLQFMMDQHINIIEENWRLIAVQRLSGDMQRLLELTASSNSEDIEKSRLLRESIEREKQLIAAKDYQEYYKKRMRDVRRDGTLSPERREQLLWQYQYVLDYRVAAEGSEWKYNLMRGLVGAMNELESQRVRTAQGGGVNRLYEQQLEKTIQIARYRIEEEKQVVAGDESSGFYYERPSQYWRSMQASIQLLPLLTLLMILVAGRIISGEFAEGTITVLLSVPAKRWKILLSKYVAVLLCGAVLLAGTYLLNGITAACFFGTSDLFAGYVFVWGDSVCEISGFLRMAWGYLLASVPLLVYTTMAFSLSTLFRSTTLAVGISTVCLFAGPYMVTWIRDTLNQDWARYLLFSNLDLDVIFSGQGLFPEQTLPAALAVTGIHLLLFWLIAWDAFLYRDVG